MMAAGQRAGGGQRRRGRTATGRGPGGAAPSGKDAGEGNSSDDAAEEKDTHARDDELKATMEEEGFNINTTHCGPLRRCALWLPLARRVKSTTLWP